MAPDDDYPFEYEDTSPGRNNTADLVARIRDERIAIVGVGGTGSYVLDFLCKTWVREIHLFDHDKLLNHNAFRSPGACSLAELRKSPRKTVFHAQRYSRMKRRVFAHDHLIDETNVQELQGFDTVFMCLDGHPIKRCILKVCVAEGALVIDTGMSVYRKNPDGTGPLRGSLQVTTMKPRHDSHFANRVDTGVDDDPGEYGARNAQSAELNAMSAAMAVIKWKKARGIYEDLRRELFSVYPMHRNKMFNDDICPQR